MVWVEGCNFAVAPPSLFDSPIPYHLALARGRADSFGSVYGSQPAYTRITSADRLSLFKVVTVLQSLYILELRRIYGLGAVANRVLGRALSPATVSNGSLGSHPRWLLSGTACPSSEKTDILCESPQTFAGYGNRSGSRPLFVPCPGIHPGSNKSF